MSPSLISRVKWENDVVKDEGGVVEGKTSICFNAIDRHFIANDGKHDPIVTWEGNFWECTEDVHDYAEFSIETLECVTRKIARALRERITGSGRLLVLLPNVIQLPLTVLAAERLGVVPVVVNPISISHERLCETLEAVKPTVIVTLDGFFQGKTLFATKMQLDEAIKESKISSIVEILVVGHVSARPGVPAPTNEYPGRRPSYSIQVPMTEGRDSEWSKVLSAMDKDVDKKMSLVWKGLPDTVIEYPQWKDKPLLASVSMRKVLECADKLADKGWESLLEILLQLPPGPSLIVSTHNDDIFTLVALIAAMIAGKKVVFFEGALDYPDPARISFMIKKYEVETLVIDSLSYLDKDYTSMVSVPSLSTVITKEIEKTPTVFSSARHLTLDLSY
ncbi:hypothetical protein PRIPAC_93730 [Pristionchus pacificus]|nr:hypothetical protein PRIPAC_93730 [Pristionchus pacificus]